jgi:hypothetical protein
MKSFCFGSQWRWPEITAIGSQSGDNDNKVDVVVKAATV